MTSIIFNFSFLPFTMLAIFCYQDEIEDICSISSYWTVVLGLYPVSMESESTMSHGRMKTRQQGMGIVTTMETKVLLVDYYTVRTIFMNDV